MVAAPLPADETQRLEALDKLAILDTAPEGWFDDLTETCAHALDVKTALVSFVDAERQWFKARCGLEVSETSRDVAFCAHAILENKPMVVLNATQDERFNDNPLVTGEPYIRFYAGAPLVTPDGYPVGTLCVLDPEPRFRFEGADVKTLTFFAELVMERLVRRVVENRAQDASAA